MPWRVHLANQAIQNLHIIQGKSPVIAAWTRLDRVEFFDLELGASLGEKILATPPSAPYESEAWQEHIVNLTAIDRKVSLPYVRDGDREILVTDDGKLRLYVSGDKNLVLDTDGVISVLDVLDVERFRAVDFDRQLGLVACIDEIGKLHLFQQDIPMGAYDIGLSPSLDVRVALVVSKGGQSLFATDGRRVVAVNSNGKVRKSFEAHYDIGRIACSPTGSMLVVSDAESGVLRAYRGDDLVLTHQKFAIELVASASQVQLIADLPPVMSAISSLAVHTQGIIAFAMAGVVCATDVTQMDELPRAKTLL